MSAKKTWSRKYVDKIALRHKLSAGRAKAAAVTVDKRSEVTAIRRGLQCGELDAVRVMSVKEMLSVCDGEGLDMRKMFECLEEDYVFPACAIIQGQPYWGYETRGLIERYARQWKKFNGDRKAFVRDPYVRRIAKSWKEL